MLSACLAALALMITPAGQAPSDAQVELYTSANAAFDEQRYDDAVRDLESAIGLGPLNILYLSLGRARQQLGDCDAARDAFAQALDSPAVVRPDTAEVSARAQRYLDELGEACPGTVAVECKATATQVGLPPAELRDCTGASWSLSPGRHQFVARIGDQEAHYEVDVTAFETTRLVVNLEPTSPPPPRLPKDAPPQSPPDRSHRLRIAGQSLFGAGLGLVVTAVVLDTVLVRGAVDEFDEARRNGDPDAASMQRRARSAQIGTIVTYVFGAAATVAGATLWGVGARRRAASSRARVGLTPSPQGLGASLTLRL